MEQIGKILKQIFFTDEGEVDIKFAAKVKYVVYGIVLGFALTIGGLCCLGNEDEDVDAVTGIELVDE